MSALASPGQPSRGAGAGNAVLPGRWGLTGSPSAEGSTETDDRPLAGPLLRLSGAPPPECHPAPRCLRVMSALAACYPPCVSRSGLPWLTLTWSGSGMVPTFAQAFLTRVRDVLSSISGVVDVPVRPSPPLARLPPPKARGRSPSGGRPAPWVRYAPAVPPDHGVFPCSRGRARRGCPPAVTIMVAHPVARPKWLWRKRGRVRAHADGSRLRPVPTLTHSRSHWDRARADISRLRPRPSRSWRLLTVVIAPAPRPSRGLQRRRLTGDPGSPPALSRSPCLSSGCPRPRLISSLEVGLGV